MKIIYTDEQLKFFRDKGRKGGNTTKKLYGLKHYKDIRKGKKGVKDK